MSTNKKKSHAQIERMKKRAAARGDVYQPSPTSTIQLEDQVQESSSERPLSSSNETISHEQQGPTASIDIAKAAVARKLVEELKTIETDSILKAKDRRSAKRKAEAIAAEAAGCSAAELIAWFGQLEKETTKEEKDSSLGNEIEKLDEQVPDDTFHQHNGKNPYVVFVGQLSYTTTKEQLLEHIRSLLGDEHDISEKTVRIRLLTDAKTGKSRGMAFVQVSNPEVLYACLKLHKTLLDGRRINVERTTGGKQHSEARQAKLKSFREEQEQYMSELVDKLLREYRTKGELVENELDDGVIKLLKRHSGQVAHAALEQYVESKGRDMDNPSAYLSFLVGKVAEEMLEEQQKQLLKKKKNDAYGKDKDKNRKRKLEHLAKDSKPKGDDNNKATTRSSKLAKSSELARAGVDMSISEGSNLPLSTIFPSMSRGRGRGRS